MHRLLRSLPMLSLYAIVAVGLSACARAPANEARVDAAGATEVATAPVADPMSPPHTPAQGCDRLAQPGLEATFVLYQPDRNRHVVCDPERARRAFLPASTFKIANALIGLETGAVRDEHEVMEWDGLKRGVPAWNQDTDLAGGMRNSTVWFYQAMARRIGAVRMREWVHRVGYGNGDIGMDDAIDHFWLDGALRITAFEEVDFIDRLRRQALPLSARSQQTVIRILERDRGDGWVLRAKSGAAVPIDARTGDVVQGPANAGLNGAEPVGWFVGWVDRGGQGDAVFAFNLKMRGNADLPLREQLARELLVANAVLPGSAKP